MLKRFSVLLAFLLCCNTVYAYDFSDKFSNSIKTQDQISYCPQQNVWSRELKNNCYTFTRYVTSGTGSFSEYEYNHTKIPANSTFEFIYDGKLIGYNHHTLKFFNMTYDGQKFQGKELSTDDLKEFFPDVEFVKISEFKNNEITLYKPLFSKKNYLLVNDTDLDFYKYFFENYKNEKTLFRALFSTIRPRTFIYSHFGSRGKLYTALFIHVKTSSLF